MTEAHHPEITSGVVAETGLVSDGEFRPLYCLHGVHDDEIPSVGIKFNYASSSSAAGSSAFISILPFMTII